MDSQPSAALWQLVFNGECLQGHDPADMRRAVVRFLKLDDARATRLFSGKRIVLRRGVSMAAAQRTIRIYAVMGAVLDAEPSKPRRARSSRVAAPARRLGAIGSIGALSVGAVLGLALVWMLVGPPPAPLPRVVAAGSVATSTAAEASAPLPATATAELPPDMSADARLHYQQRYLSLPGHKAFAISAGGSFAVHSGASSANDAAERAIATCMAARRPGDDGCRVVDLDGELLE